jgi:hypothetical protein
MRRPIAFLAGAVIAMAYLNCMSAIAAPAASLAPSDVVNRPAMM